MLKVEKWVVYRKVWENEFYVEHKPILDFRFILRILNRIGLYKVAVKASNEQTSNSEKERNHPAEV